MERMTDLHQDRGGTMKRTDEERRHVRFQWIGPKWHPIPYNALLWSQVVNYKGNTVPFGTQAVKYAGAWWREHVFLQDNERLI
jgi:hypothetical protein